MESVAEDRVAKRGKHEQPVGIPGPWRFLAAGSGDCRWAGSWPAAHQPDPAGARRPRRRVRRRRPGSTISASAMERPRWSIRTAGSRIRKAKRPRSGSRLRTVAPRRYFPIYPVGRPSRNGFRNCRASTPTDYRRNWHSGGRPVNKLIEVGTDGLSIMFWQLQAPLE